MVDRPVIDDAPGLAWRLRKKGWEARWRPRADLLKRGLKMNSAVLWQGLDLNDKQREFIQEACRRLQDEMLAWSRGGSTAPITYDGTMLGLIRCYQTDQDSSYQGLRYRTRQSYDSYLRRIEKDCGDVRIADIDARMLKRWHEGWVKSGVSMAHSLVGIVRTLTTFGATLLKCKDCRELKVTLSDMRFKNSTPRTERLTADHVIAIRAKAHEKGMPSLALAQAFQFDCILRQKDVIGEWVPLSEPGPLTALIDGNEKWMRGLRWEEIDDDLVLQHTTSKRLKDHEVDLKLAEMVLEEIRLQFPNGLPEAGPVIVSEKTLLPWDAPEFRRQWRIVATAAGVPKHIYNMDSRAGAISEATDSGADLEHVRQAATHGDIAMTQRYSRNQRSKTDNVMTKRAEFRKNNTGTK